MKYLISIVFAFIFFGVAIENVYASESGFVAEQRFGPTRYLFPTFVPSIQTMTPTIDAFRALPNININANQPEDLFVCRETYTFFVADTGNSRILAFSLDGFDGETTYIGEGTLVSPFGVAADADRIYVADAGLNEVVVFNRLSGEVELRISRPTEHRFGRDTSFTPRKIASDARGSIYVVSDNSPSGVMQFNANGEFLGFLGENHSSLGFISTLQRMIYTAEQRDRLIDVRPPSPTNLSINDYGMLLTVTTGVGDVGAKLFSMANEMLLRFPGSGFIDITTDSQGIIYLIHSSGPIALVTPTGNYLFYFNTRTLFFEKNGVTNVPVAIDVGQNGVIYALDRSLPAIIRFEPTEFGALALEASHLFSQGFFLAGNELWQEALELNATFNLAHQAVGFANFRQNNFEEALRQFRLSYTPIGYSNVVWHLRNLWLLDNLQYVILIFILFIFMNSVLNFYLRRKKLKHPVRIILENINSVSPFWLKRLGFELEGAFYFCRAPIDGVYEIKRNKMVGLATANFIFAVYLFIFILNAQITSFPFKFYTLYGFAPLPVIIAGASLPVILGIVSSFLISEIKDGEATFKQVYIIVACSLIPFTIFSFARAVFSNILTFYEMFFFNAFFIIGLAWTLFLVIAGLKEGYDYTLRGVFANLFQTIFVSACFIVVVAVSAMLVTQEFEFLRILIGEVAFRVQS